MQNSASSSQKSVLKRSLTPSDNNFTTHFIAKTVETLSLVSQPLIRFETRTVWEVVINLHTATHAGRSSCQQTTARLHENLNVHGPSSYVLKLIKICARMPVKKKKPQSFAIFSVRVNTFAPHAKNVSPDMQQIF